jgi:hypothetical protein
MVQTMTPFWPEFIITCYRKPRPDVDVRRYQAPLAEGALSLNRDQIGKFQKQMTGRVNPPGRAMTLRV